MTASSTAPVRVVVDSTADVPPDLAAELGIEVIPCWVHFGQEARLDGVDLSREEFYARLESGKVLPTTAVPAVGTFAAVYQRLAEQTQYIISIHPAAKLSGLYNAARLGAEAVSDAKIAIIDSNQATMGTGWLAVIAARAARAGQTLEQVVALVCDAIPRLRLVALIDDLHFLQRSGRVDWVGAMVGSLLSIKPIIGLRDGQVQLLGKVRTKAKALEQLRATLISWGPMQELAIMHCNALADGQRLADMVAPIYPRERLIIAPAGTVISSHAGPRAVAFVGIRAGE
jgi:DegV family protein with EDD domain